MIVISDVRDCPCLKIDILMRLIKLFNRNGIMFFIRRDLLPICTSDVLETDLSC